MGSGSGTGWAGQLLTALPHARAAVGCGAQGPTCHPARSRWAIPVSWWKDYFHALGNVPLGLSSRPSSTQSLPCLSLGVTTQFCPITPPVSVICQNDSRGSGKRCAYNYSFIIKETTKDQRVKRCRGQVWEGPELSLWRSVSRRHQGGLRTPTRTHAHTWHVDMFVRLQGPESYGGCVM